MIPAEWLAGAPLAGVAFTAAVEPDGAGGFRLGKVGGLDRKLRTALDYSFPGIHTVVVSDQEDLAPWALKRAESDHSYAIDGEEGRDFRVITAGTLAEAVERLRLRLEDRRLGEKPGELPPPDPDFVGRETLFRELDDWVEATPTGYLVLVGGMGRGKTTALAEYVRRRAAAGVPPVYYFIEGESNSASVAAIADSLLSRLRHTYLVSAPTDVDKDRTAEEKLENYLRQLSRERLTDGRKLLLVLDAADQADLPAGKFLLPDVLRRQLPDGVVCIITSRGKLNWLNARVDLRDLSEDLNKWDRYDLPELTRKRNRRLDPPLPEEFVAKILAAEPFPVAFTLRKSFDELERGGAYAEQLRQDAALWSQPPEELIREEAKRLIAKFETTGGTEAQFWKTLALIVFTKGASPALLQSLGVWKSRVTDAVLRLAASFFKPQPHRIAADGYHFDHPGYEREVLSHLGPADSRKIYARLAKGARAAWRDPADPARDFALTNLPTLLRNAGRKADLPMLLCDLEFTEARCRSGLMEQHLQELQAAIDDCPERLQELRDEKARQEMLARYVNDLVAHAGDPDRIPCPAPPPCAPIAPEPPRKPSGWTAMEHLMAWRQVITQNREAVQDPACSLFQTAYNFAEDGPVAEQVKDWQKKGRAKNTAWIRQTIRPPFVLRTPCVHILPNAGHVVAMSLDKRFAVTGDCQGIVRIWDLKQGIIKHEFRGHDGEVSAVALSADGRRAASGAADGQVQVWDTERGLQVCKLAGHDDSVRALVLSADGRRAASGADDGTLRVWNESDKPYLDLLDRYFLGVECVALSADGRRVAFGAGNILRVWEVGEGRALASLDGHHLLIGAVALSADGRRAVCGDSAGKVHVWDVDVGCELAVLDGHGGDISAVSLSADARRVVSSNCFDGTLLVWDISEARVLAVLAGHGVAVNSVALSADGRQIASAGYDNVRIWEISAEHALTPRISHGLRTNSVAISSGGQRAISGGNDGTVRVWDVYRGRQQAVLEGHEEVVHAVALNGAATRAASLGDDGTIMFWDTNRQCQLAALTLHKGRAVSVTWRGDGRIAILGGADSIVRLWDVPDRCELAILAARDGDTTAVALSADGRRAASGSLKGIVRVWDAANKRSLRVLKGHHGKVTSVALSADGRRVASAGGDGSVRLWVDSVRRELAVLGKHRGWVNVVALTADGEQVASGGDDGTVRIWDVSQWRCINVFYADTSITALDWIGRSLLIGCMDGTVQFLKLEGICLAPTLVVPTRQWVFKTRSLTGHWDKGLSVYCPECGHKCAARQDQLGQHITCKCGEPLRLANFTCDWKEKLT